MTLARQCETGGLTGGAYLLRTLDAGETWTAVALSDLANHFVDVFFLVGSAGTEDGGETWAERLRSAS